MQLTERAYTIPLPSFMLKRSLVEAFMVLKEVLTVAEVLAPKSRSEYHFHLYQLLIHNVDVA